MATKIEDTFRAPKGVTTFKAITICELDGDAERDAAHWADMRVAKEQIAKDDIWARSKVEREEEIRASVVAVDGAPVQKAGAPWTGFDKWPKRAKLAAGRFHDAMNGLDTADLEKCVAEVMNPETPRPNEKGAATGEPAGG
jgi:hypothetical protein